MKQESELIKLSKQVTPNIIQKITRKYGIPFSDIRKSKNYDTIKAGCELMYLSESDVLYMLDVNTSKTQATNRLVTRRRERCV